MMKNTVKIYEFGLAVPEEMSFKAFFLSSLLCSVKKAYLDNIGIVRHEKHTCEIILIFDQLFMRRYSSNIFLI